MFQFYHASLGGQDLERMFREIGAVLAIFRRRKIEVLTFPV
jgi:hypothetical protein